MPEGLYNPPFQDPVTLQRVISLEGNNRFLAGTYTVDTLPLPSASPFMYAAVTDLGGGADFVVSDGSYWKIIRRGTLLVVAANTNINVLPLKSPTIFSVSGSISTNMSVIVDTNRLYPGYQITVKRQNALSTTVGLIGSLGIKTNTPNASQLSLTDTSSNLIWDGSQFQQI